MVVRYGEVVLSATTPEAALEDLLATTFSPAEFLRLVGRYAYLESLSRSLYENGSTSQTFFCEAVACLRRYGLIGTQLFGILKIERPNKIEDINQVELKLLVGQDSQQTNKTQLEEAKTQTISYEITLQGEASEDEVMLLLAKLREVSGAFDIRLRGYRSGSIVLILESTPEVADTLRAAIESGVLREVLGHPILTFKHIDAAASTPYLDPERRPSLPNIGAKDVTDLLVADLFRLSRAQAAGLLAGDEGDLVVSGEHVRRLISVEVLEGDMEKWFFELRSGNIMAITVRLVANTTPGGRQERTAPVEVSHQDIVTRSFAWIPSEQASLIGYRRS